MASNTLKCKCLACGHVWDLIWLPVGIPTMARFSKLPCPKCHDKKPVLAGKDDQTTEERLLALLKRAHAAMSRRDPDGYTPDWAGEVAALAEELKEKP